MDEQNYYEVLEAYIQYIMEQKKGFIAFINFIGNLVNELYRQGKISEWFEIRARIKSLDSAIHNDTEENGKALDDVFGMEIIAGNQEELKEIKKKLEQYTKTVKEKNHNKQNGYKAHHISIDLNDDVRGQTKLFYGIERNNIPLLEVQLKTVEDALKCLEGGTADHTTYKKTNKQEIQRKFNKGELTFKNNVPLMWVGNAKTEGKMKQLSLRDTIKKMYPFLNTTTATQNEMGTPGGKER